jgi:hypothetical protein
MGLLSWLLDTEGKGYESFLWATDKGHRAAKYMVGRCMDSGAGTKLDTIGANKLFQELAAGSDFAALLATTSVQVGMHCASEIH